MGKRIIIPRGSLIKNIVFVSIGFIALIIALVVLIKGLNEDSKFVSTNAIVKTIVENQDERYIIVSYDVDGTTYDAHLPYFDATLDIGDNIQIKYNPNDYTEINSRRKGYLFTSISLLFVALFIITYTGFSLLSFLKEKQRITYLLTNGKKYEAIIIAVEENEKNKLSGIVPSILACTISLNDKTYALTSKDIFIEANLSGYVNKHVSVYTEDDEFTNYYIDYMEVK